MKVFGLLCVAAACPALALDAGGVYSSDAIATARAVSVMAHYTEISVPRTKCWTAEVVGQDRSLAGSILGGIAGGILGHQVGKGSGNVAATAAGAITGVLVGDRLGNSSAESPRLAEKCAVVQESERRQDGYDVVYEYAGQRFQARTRRDPGEAVTIRLRPIVVE